MLLLLLYLCVNELKLLSGNYSDVRGRIVAREWVYMRAVQYWIFIPVILYTCSYNIHNYTLYAIIPDIIILIIIIINYAVYKTV